MKIRSIGLKIGSLKVFFCSYIVIPIIFDAFSTHDGRPAPFQLHVQFNRLSWQSVFTHLLYVQLKLRRVKLSQA